MQILMMVACLVIITGCAVPLASADPAPKDPNDSCNTTYITDDIFIENCGGEYVISVPPFL